jgi:hypothetical protein
MQWGFLEEGGGAIRAWWRLTGLRIWGGGDRGQGEWGGMAVRGLVAFDWIAYLKDSAVWEPHHLTSLVSCSRRKPGSRLTLDVCRSLIQGHTMDW